MIQAQNMFKEPIQMYLHLSAQNLFFLPLYQTFGVEN